MRKHLLAIALILTVAPGCDNVGWGGIDVHLLPPPENPNEPAEEESVGEVRTPDRIPGPILLAGIRDGERGDFVVVGEIAGDAIRPFPDPDYPEDTLRLQALTAQGSEWILFSEGVRIGHMTTAMSGPARSYCGGRTALSGVVEMVPSAAGAERLLALPSADGASRPYEPYGEIQHDYDQRVASLSIAGDAIPRYGASWPERGVLDARAHIQAFQLKNTPGPSIAATFLSNDQLQVGAPGQGSYALFVMGHEEGGTYVEAYTWFRDAAADGKGAPRYFDHLDLDGDGSDEIVLDVFGANRRWFATLGRRDGSWTRTYQDRCTSNSVGG